MKRKYVCRKRSKWIEAGRKAFENGQPRMPPTEFVNGSKHCAISMWLIGWDIAKLFAERERLTPVVQLNQKRKDDMP